MAANLGVRFALELCMLAAIGYWGFHSHGGATAWLLGLGAPTAAAVVWGAVVAPKPAVRAPDPARPVAELVLVAAATAGLAAAGRHLLAVAFAAAWGVNRLLLAVTRR
jgi:Protein of unknown function (DUF2568)